VSGLDIPEGTKIEKIIKGGDTALQVIMGLLSENSFSGYVRVKLDRDDENITSYMVIEESEPRLGLRECVKRDDKNPRRRVRRVYAGKNTLNEVKNDFTDEDAVIELHSGVDVDTIISKYDKSRKPSEEDAEDDDIGPKRIGLFWGGKGQPGALEREHLLEKLNTWEKEGYDITELEAAMSMEISECKASFDRFEEDVETLKEMAAELEILALAGFEDEVADLKSKLQDPTQIPEIREKIEILESKMGTGKVPAGDGICLVCGFPVEGLDKCPRCGASIEAGKVEIPNIPQTPQPVKEDGIALEDGHCYIIEEEKLDKSVRLFTETLNKGYTGLCITRTNPKHIKGISELEDVTIMWLTDKESETEDTIPAVLERIMYEISDFLRREENGCLILDGIEYLVSNNGFDAVLRFIRRMVDEFSESKSVLLVAVSPFTLKERELKILEREMEKI
jgi:rubrerythrin